MSDRPGTEVDVSADDSPHHANGTGVLDERSWIRTNAPLVGVTLGVIGLFLAVVLNFEALASLFVKATEWVRDISAKEFGIIALAFFTGFAVLYVLEKYVSIAKNNNWLLRLRAVSFVGGVVCVSAIVMEQSTSSTDHFSEYAMSIGVIVDEQLLDGGEVDEEEIRQSLRQIASSRDREYLDEELVIHREGQSLRSSLNKIASSTFGVVLLVLREEESQREELETWGRYDEYVFFHMDPLAVIRPSGSSNEIRVRTSSAEEADVASDMLVVEQVNNVLVIADSAYYRSFNTVVSQISTRGWFGRVASQDVSNAYAECSAIKSLVADGEYDAYVVFAGKENAVRIANCVGVSPAVKHVVVGARSGVRLDEMQPQLRSKATILTLTPQTQNNDYIVDMINVTLDSIEGIIEEDMSSSRFRDEYVRLVGDESTRSGRVVLRPDNVLMIRPSPQQARQRS